jgi:hypothetical protein
MHHVIITRVVFFLSLLLSCACVMFALAVKG